MYSAYALAGPSESITWSELVYIGISQNIQYRYSQHLMCSDDSQEEKNDWVRGILAQGRYPSLWLLQNEIAEVEEARSREQYLIRYAMSQGAKLLNKQITYIDNEQQDAREKRAMRYAKIAELKHQGYFVKRSVFWHPSTGKHARGKAAPAPYRIHMRDFVFLLLKDERGEYVPIGKCSDAFFDAFIKQHLSVIDGGHTAWGWEDRLEAINTAMAKGCELDLCRGEKAAI